MSTVGLFSKRMDERELLAKLAANRAEQIAELDELVEMHANGEGLLEKREEEISECIDDICKANALGVQGPTMAQLSRIRNELIRLNTQLEEHERYNRLVQLCMNGARSVDEHSRLTLGSEMEITAEVDRLKAEEMPF